DVTWCHHRTPYGTWCHQLCSEPMSRWKPDAQGRLMSAAIELFDEQGYEETTVADIAEGAGLTKRTFFRYFSDKREVLFSGSDEVKSLWLEALAGAIKAALVERGVSANAATLAAQAGVPVFHVGFDSWVSQDDPAAFARLM